MVEFAVVLVLENNHKSQDSTLEEDVERRRYVDDKSENQEEECRCRKLRNSCSNRLSLNVQIIEKYALFTFSLSFMVFNLIYWLYYLTK